ncbi:ethanolamine kinase, putative [Entamoeba invadens IP1]|uniref:ethanolamine kinase n=1 Tax=Entamoeba invadens IP1 TaxID=370355 RepID=A0A0A1U4V1_ENTIV|nr:ethanolamine kinase, putative [Entamoeba invadens IP1]ELP87913.1 ethanolamine kinase, putative [Entamoeba invadens IP1]|eukprot:XP_004254684.1 ethanolamine kinase, putative [Entamoeba invadens IP1]
MSYDDLIPSEERNIKAIAHYPHLISYNNYLSNSLRSPAPDSITKLPSLFVAIDTMNNSNFTKSIIYVVKKLVPNFKDTQPDKFSFRHFTEGITNKLVCITDTTTNFSVNVRTYGSYTEYVIDRKQELLVTEACSTVTLYGTFLNGVVYSYIPGRTLCLGDLIDLKTFKDTAVAIARHHKITPPLVKAPLLFVTLRKWLANVPLEYVDQKKTPYPINVLKDELVFLENKLKDKSDVVLCHNDLLLKNFIKSTDGVSLIDFEYSSYNYRAFDLANHFCEWCGFECNWDSYPNQETQRRFISMYLSAYYKKPAEELIGEIEKILEDVKWFELASHFYWGTWSLIQAALSSIDFDYTVYAYERFNRYFVVKKNLMG